MHSIRWLTHQFADWECHPDRCLSYFYANYWTYHNGLWRGILDRDGACVSGTAVHHHQQSKPFLRATS